MAANASDLAAWENILVAEAKRDCVFVFNIASGAFGGPRPAPSGEELPALLERVATVLLKSGCEVGFAMPDASGLEVPERLRVPQNLVPSSIARFYSEDPEQAKFLVFVHRAQHGSESDA